MRYLMSALFALLLPQALAASCEGTDLRAGLSPAEQAALTAAAEATPFPEGNRWRAVRGDRVIDVVGTIHIPDPRLDPVMARLTPDIERAERLFLEANEEDRQALQRNLAADTSLLLLQDTSLPELLEEGDWQALAEAARSRGIPAVMAAKMQPWYLSLVLALPGCAMDLMQDGGGLDARIEAVAAEAEVPRSSIEAYDTVFRVFNEEPLEDQLDMLRLGVFPEATGADLLVTTVNSYFDEAHSDNWRLSRQMTFAHLDLPQAQTEAMLDEMEAKLLTDRNLAWIEVIEAAPEDRLMVAVGAAHLMGESGLLNQLQARGYDLERLEF
ncbi:TraB/GumN family protein [Marinovum sp.]|uniref:TraB/GumN family protein n=1 Tax=Marinovum sp. TaxID=2024839 RepID=UPI002B27A529|nr:TraB/GumN family protein [Marinovum sp.]